MIRIDIHGVPKPGGSKKGFYSKKRNRVFIVDDCTKSKDWRADVVQQSVPQCPVILQGPLNVVVCFLLTRPKGHYNAKGALRPSAPRYPIVKPDATKLWRSTEDALTGIAWKDDAQIVSQLVTKRYASRSGCIIFIEEAADPQPN